VCGTEVPALNKNIITSQTSVAHSCNPTQEAEIRRITVRSQPGKIVCETLSPKKPSQKTAGGVAQVKSACIASIRL
jgi:hypothetical protein